MAAISVDSANFPFLELFDGGGRSTLNKFETCLLLQAAQRVELTDVVLKKGYLAFCMDATDPHVSVASMLPTELALRLSSCKF